MNKICTNCNKRFYIRNSDGNRGRGLFCGRSCAQSGRHGNTYIHGKSNTTEYRSWAMAKARVKGQVHSEHYFDRGITMCDEWFNNFEQFLKDMGDKPTPLHTLDRIDVNGNYEPSNCKWSTHTEQMNNVRTNRLLTLSGVTKTQEEWGRMHDLTGTIICKRLKRGWSVERALLTPRLR